MTHEPPHEPRPSDDHGPVTSPQRARQGRPGVRVLVILIVSLALIVLLYLLLWGGTQEQMGDLETVPEQKAAAETFEGDASGPPPPANGVQPPTSK